MLTLIGLLLQDFNIDALSPEKVIGQMKKFYK
jgi:hypothetical protein